MICVYCTAPARHDPELEDDDGEPMCADCFASGFQYIPKEQNSKSGSRWMGDTITIVCGECGKRANTPRCDTDPPNASELHGTVCPDCDNGGFDMPVYFDASGQEVDGDLMKYKGSTDV